MDLRVRRCRTSHCSTNSACAVLLLILLLVYSLCCCSCNPFAPAAFLGPLPASSRMWRVLSHHQQLGTTAAHFLLPTQHRTRLTVTAALASSAASKVKKTTAATTTTTRKMATRAKPSSAKSKAASSTTKKATTTRATTSKASAAAASGEADGMKPGMKLIIVESATKANTIKRFLSSDKGNGKWEVDYCMGHVRELPRTAADMPPTAKKEKNKVRGCQAWGNMGDDSGCGVAKRYIMHAQRKSQPLILRKHSSLHYPLSPSLLSPAVPSCPPSLPPSFL